MPARSVIVLIILLITGPAVTPGLRAQSAPTSRPAHLGSWIDFDVGTVIRSSGDDSATVTVDGRTETVRHVFDIEEIIWARTPTGFSIARFVDSWSFERNPGQHLEPDIDFFTFDRSTGAFTLEPREGGRYGANGPSLPDSRLPAIAAELLDRPASWITSVPFDEEIPNLLIGARHQVLAGPTPDRRRVVFSVEPAPQTLMTPYGRVVVHERKETFDLDIARRRLLAFERSIHEDFGRDEKRTLQVKEVERTVLAGAALDRMVAEVRALREMHVAWMIRPETVAPMVAAFERSFQDSARLALARCLSARARSEAEMQAIAADEERRRKALIGKPAPDFTLNDLAGRPVALSSFRGRVVFLTFWGVG